jgi:hypothetical protein
MQKVGFCSLVVVVIGLLCFCQRSRPTIMGLPCYTAGSKTKVHTVTQTHMKNYQHLKDTVFQLPHAPIHRVLKRPEHLTYVGIYTDDSLASIKDSLSIHSYLTKQRTDSLGFHCMLDNEGQKAYIFITAGKEGPLLFLNRGKSDTVISNAFMNKQYYAKRLACD